MDIDWNDDESVVRAANTAMDCQTYKTERGVESVYMGYSLGLGETWTKARYSTEKIREWEEKNNPNLLFPERPSFHQIEQCTHDTLRYYTVDYAYKEDVQEYAVACEKVITDLLERTPVVDMEKALYLALKAMVACAAEEHKGLRIAEEAIALYESKGKL